MKFQKQFVNIRKSADRKLTECFRRNQRVENRNIIQKYKRSILNDKRRVGIGSN